MPVCAVCNAGFVVRTMGQAAPAAALSAAPAVSLGRRDPFDLPEDVVGDPEERRIRPTLAVLYRLAVGPAADYYAPRFLRYEQAGHSQPGFHWQAMMLGPLWAFYRRLWIAGAVYAAMPVGGALAIQALSEQLDDWNVPWLIGAALLIWLLPSLCAATLAHSFLYRRIRRLVRNAEACTVNAAQAAQVIIARPATSGAAGLLIGAGSIVLALGIVAPDMLRSYSEHAVRTQVAQTIASVKQVQEVVEEQWERSGHPPHQAADLRQIPDAWTQVLDELSVNPATGRLRLLLGPGVPQLWGKTLLLAPALDVFQHVRWFCIPIDIPARYLPKECR